MPNATGEDGPRAVLGASRGEACHGGADPHRRGVAVDRWIDELARALATGRSRRALLRGALGAAAAAALGSLVPWEPSEQAEAVPPGPDVSRASRTPTNTATAGPSRTPTIGPTATVTPTPNTGQGHGSGKKCPRDCPDSQCCTVSGACCPNGQRCPDGLNCCPAALVCGITCLTAPCASGTACDPLSGRCVDFTPTQTPTQTGT